ncbi:hypothetical protein FRB94_000063 [Tulasnella sp. JGI-2019a]|nr:hypothetical protein FRB94_000063 [Tulasnella sp. JGI-2019a]
MEDILVVGWGAVGILYGYTLHRSGRVRLTVVARSNYEAAKSGQITITSHQFGSVTDFISERGWRSDVICLVIQLTLRYQVVRSVAEAADRSYSFVLITTKALPDVLPTSKLLEPLLSPSYTYPQPAYALLQNGLGIEKDLYAGLTKRAPLAPPQIITCAVYCDANLIENDMRHPTGLPKLEIGLFDPRGSARREAHSEGASVTSFKNLVEAGGGAVTIAEDIQAAKFRKNIWNVVFATFSCLTRVPPAFYIATPALWGRVAPLFRETGEEVLAVGRAIGYSEKHLPTDAIQGFIDGDVASYSDAQSEHKPSTLLDIEANKPFEVEVIVGEVVRAGRQLGVPIPRMEAIYTMLSVVQAHNLKG